MTTWDQDDLALLRSLLSSGAGYRRIAVLLGHSYSSVASMSSQLKKQGLVKRCAVPGCTGRYYAGSYCKRHYSKARRMAA